jgi:hypothetical protein
MSIEWLNRLSDRAILLVLLIIGVATSGASFVFNVTNEGVRGEWLEGWFQNFSTEMFGAFLGFWLLGMIVDRRRQAEAKQEARAESKARLIREMGSKDNATALNAVSALRAYEWLNDGSLREAFLQGANLTGANLQKANLQWVELQSAKLQQADLKFANLTLALFQGANLTYTDLAGVDLRDANLQDSNIRNARFDDKTTLPDGTRWSPDIDLARFSDPDHPNFWRSDGFFGVNYPDNADST